MKVDNDFRHHRCPLCHSSQIVSLGSANYRGSVIYSTRDIDLVRVPEIWSCQECDSGFTQNIVPREISISLYMNSAAGERWSIVPFEQNKPAEIVRVLTGLLTDHGRILDYGCNTGELLDFAAQFDCDTWGVEYSAESRDIVIGKGHKAASTIDEIEGQFDLITAFDLVEHLYDVAEFLEGCYKKLVVGGKLILLTGDFQSHSARRAGARWWYAQYPEHIVFPSRKFFGSLKGYSLESWLPTFASRGYEFSVARVLLSRLKDRLLGRDYTGIPSFSPDHALVVLSKIGIE